MRVGETFGPSHVKRVGMGEPSTNAGLERLNGVGMVDSVGVGLGSMGEGVTAGVTSGVAALAETAGGLGVAAPGAVASGVPVPVGPPHAATINPTRSAPCRARPPSVTP
jgi:hypothetical protein